MRTDVGPSDGPGHAMPATVAPMRLAVLETPQTSGAWNLAALWLVLYTWTVVDREGGQMGVRTSLRAQSHAPAAGRGPTSGLGAPKKAAT